MFDNDEMMRDFTFIDDIAHRVLATLDRPPAVGEASPPHRPARRMHPASRRDPMPHPKALKTRCSP